MLNIGGDYRGQLEMNFWISKTIIKLIAGMIFITVALWMVLKIPFEPGNRGVITVVVAVTVFFIILLIIYGFTKGII